MPGDASELDHQRRAATPVFVRARRRAWAALVCALFGIWASHALGGPSHWWFGGAVVMALAGAALPRRWWWIGACGAVIGGMGGWAAVRFREPPPDRLDRVAAEGIVTLIARVASSPERVRPPEGPGAPGAWRAPGLAFDAGVEALVGPDAGLIAVQGTVGVRASVAATDLFRMGDRVRITGSLTRSQPPRNPGEPDWTRYANERGRAGWLSVPDETLILPEPGGGRWWAPFVRARDGIRRRASDALGADPGGVLAALVLGERDRRFDETYRVFQRAGVAHVLAVSGFHLAMLGCVVVLAVRLTGERGRLEVLAALIVVGGMLVMVPARAPIVRAGVLVLALLLGDALGRRWDRLSVLAWAGLGLLVWRPGDALALGYPLSVGVTALLIAMGEQDRARRWSMFDQRGAQSVVRGWLAGAIRVNAACWAAAMPTIVVFTGVCSLIAPIATVVMVPLAGVLLIGGWAQALLGVVWPAGAARTAGVLGWLSVRTADVARWFDGLPGSSVTVVGVGWAWAGVSTAFVLAFLFRRVDRRVSAAGVAACVVWAGVATHRSGRVEGLRADMLDVGDGTCILLRSGSEAMLWDCGGLHRPVGGMVTDAARALGIARVRTAVVTHANLDHYNGLPEVAERLGLEVLWVTPAMGESRSGDWGDIRGMLEGMGVRVMVLEAGDALPLGDATGSVLWAGASDAPRWLGNDGSLVVRFGVDTQAGERSVLLCGDLQAAGIAGVLGNVPELRTDVVEAPHHGSAHPPAVAFVEGLSPTHVMQSTGPGRVGLPVWSGVRAQTQWLCTSESGAVFVHIRPDGTIVDGSVREDDG